MYASLTQDSRGKSLQQTKEITSIMDDLGPFQITCFLAVDWTMWDEMCLKNVDDKDPMMALICGFVIREDDEYVYVAQQIFDNDQRLTRNVLMVPKSCIYERKDLNLDEGDD